MEINDKQLIDGYLNGDEAAFNELVKKYLQPVYNFVFQLVKDRLVSEDITQETFVKAWKNLKKFDPQRSRFTTLQGRQNKSFKTWIFAIAKNTAFDYFKKKKTVPFASFTDEAGDNKLDNIADDSLALEEILATKEVAEQLAEKLEQIPEPYKIILLLHYKEDFSLPEIATILGAPYNTVKSRHSRALSALKNLF